MKNCTILIFLICFLFMNEGNAQSTTKFNFGAELDVLPFATGGHFGAIWMGKNHWRVRALTALVYKPDWSTQKGFTNHRIQAFAWVADYFPSLQWKKWWIGGGPVIWKSNISNEDGQESNAFYNYLLNGSLGYNMAIGRHFYISPWMGMSLKIAGDKNVIAGNSIYNLPVLNPELSVKAGIFF